MALRPIMIFAYDYHAQLAYVMTFDHPHAHNFALGTSTVSYKIVVGLIYLTWSAVKSGCMLVAHDIRKQESYRLNLP